MSTIRSHSSTRVLASGARAMSPALFTNTSMRPNRSSAALTKASTSVRFVTSTARASAWPPVRSISERTASSRSILRAPRNSFAPLEASRRAVASLALALLLGLVGCGKNPVLSSEFSRFPRTSRGTWSNEGWEGLRWGMGPGDVEVHLAKAMKAGGEYAPEKSYAEEARLKMYSLTKTTRKLGGEASALRFYFLDDRLYMVSEHVEMPVAEARRGVRSLSTVRSELAKHLGEPKNEQGLAIFQSAELDESAPYGARWERRSPVSLFMIAWGEEPAKHIMLSLKTWQPADYETAQRIEGAVLTARVKREAPERLSREIRLLAASPEPFDFCSRRGSTPAIKLERARSPAKKPKSNAC